MTLGELSEVAQQPIICLDSMDGRIVFKRYENVNEKNKNYTHFKKYKGVNVLYVWSEIVSEKSCGFTNIAHSVIKCYLLHSDLEQVIN